MTIKGIVRKDKKTKKLINRLNPGDIALLCHRDIDEIAAISLIESKVKAVLNVEKTLSGKYPNRGPLLLNKSGIPIFEVDKTNIFDLINEGDELKIDGNKIIYKNRVISFCKIIDIYEIEKMMEIGNSNLEKELDRFIENTLEYAKKEKGLVLGKVKIPQITTKIKGKHALVVVRGKGYKRDLEAIQNYVKEVRPVLIGVDGGGDAILEFGLIPDIVIGDMDSVTDRCLKVSKEIIVHAYPDGRAPGMARLNSLDINPIVFSSPGTSEDIALLLCYSKGADLIVAVGTHNNMIDFLEKGRNGMASTFLVRLKIGDKLVDAKGVSKLYRSNLKLRYVIGIGLAALIPILVITMMFPPMRDLLKLIQIRFKILFGL